MMRKIPDAFVEELRRRLDIVEIVSEYVQLRRTGRSWVGLCPFHNERTPSFSVSPDRQMYHCFGCGAGGTVIRFVMDIDGLTFPEAVVKLAERAGLDAPFSLDETPGATPHSRIDRMKEAHELAAKLYSYILMNTSAGVQALTYLETRGFPRQSLVEFGLGYAPKGSDTLVRFLRRRGFAESLLVEAGLAVDVGGRVMDRFRDRVMVPIRNLQGKVIGFGGRALAPDAKPKYLNSPESPLFRKSEVLFHLDAARRQIRKSGTAVLMEGYMDVIAASRAGVTNAVASMGTSLTEQHAQLLKRYAERVILAYDGDPAGIQAAKRALDVLEQAGLSVQVALFPEGEDPDDFIRARGERAFQRYLQANAWTEVQFLLQDLRRNANLESMSGKMAFLRDALEVLAQRATPIEQDAEIRELAREFEVSVDALKEELSQLAKTLPGRRRPRRRFERITGAAPLPKGYVLAGNRLLQAMLLEYRWFQMLMQEGLDELPLPEQTALLAHIYQFRSEHPEADAALLLDQLDEPELVRLTSSLLIEEPPLLDARILQDYLRTVRLYQLETEYQRVLQESVQAQVDGRLDDAAALREKMEALQRQIQDLKLPQWAGKSGTGLKEAGQG
ncbi:DNA primase [Alicyclobacillus macrosporangiidus]|uniref:DNA primase n=1 Tax=Alicyclobacillus macrosporangiidus TaxID=392015 RepID=UPI0006919A9A|nr:DNA primase [Alicyclobacillus macrosporangiidus]